MIFLEPKFGLANRLRVIASGIDLSQETNKEVTIVWENTHELNCDFEELFKPIDNLTFIKKSGWHFRIKNNPEGTLENIVPTLINKALGIDFCVKTLTAPHLKRGASLDIFKIAKSKNNIYITTCDEFCEGSATFSKFKPTDELKGKLDEVTKLFTKDTFGLHIRRTDHVDAIGNSPLSLFTDLVAEKLATNENTVFYLSTDDPETERSLKDTFGDRIITRKKDFSRDTPQGIKDALLDMFCLASTTTIYGSFNSSFSDVAARIGNIPLIILSA